MLDWVPEWGIAIALGLLGGVLRVVIGNVVVRPQRGVDDSGKRVYYLGSLSTVVVGAAAGFVAWALTTGELFKDEGFGAKTVAATILAGIAGTEILLNYVNRKLGVATTAICRRTDTSRSHAVSVSSSAAKRRMFEASRNGRSVVSRNALYGRWMAGAGA